MKGTFAPKLSNMLGTPGWRGTSPVLQDFSFDDEHNRMHRRPSARFAMECGNVRPLCFDGMKLCLWQGAWEWFFPKLPAITVSEKLPAGWVEEDVSPENLR